MLTVTHLTMAEMEQNLDEIRLSPRDGGRLSLIVRRPLSGEREVIEEGRVVRQRGTGG